MSHHQCCCNVGPFTRLTQCDCTEGSGNEPPTYVSDYSPSMGCAYIYEDRGGPPSDVCWYVGPESPTKESLDAGDVDITGEPITPVASAILACCLCCGCGAQNPDPLFCFDTGGTCDCCPEDEDGSEWIWTWSNQWSAATWNRFDGIKQRADEGNCSGTMHWKNVAGTLCDKVESVDLIYEVEEWVLDPSDGVFKVWCSVNQAVSDCADLADYFNDVWAPADQWKPLCGKQAVLRAPGEQPWIIPNGGGGTSCVGRSFGGSGLGLMPAWGLPAWHGYASCNWTGQTYTAGSEQVEVDGTITMQGSCVWSRVEWDYVVTRRFGAGGPIVGRDTQRGHLEWFYIRPPCPGGCGAAARFFGTNSIPPAGGVSPLWVPRSLEGLLQ